jgi:hypothetical protein
LNGDIVSGVIKHCAADWEAFGCVETWVDIIGVQDYHGLSNAIKIIVVSSVEDHQQIIDWVIIEEGIRHFGIVQGNKGLINAILASLINVDQIALGGGIHGH